MNDGGRVDEDVTDDFRFLAAGQAFGPPLPKQLENVQRMQIFRIISNGPRPRYIKVTRTNEVRRLFPMI